MEALRKCQKLVGEVLWLSVRTRPDISFAVSRLSQWMGRSPRRVFGLAIQLLAFLMGTEGTGLICQQQDVAHDAQGAGRLLAWV